MAGVPSIADLSCHMRPPYSLYLLSRMSKQQLPWVLSALHRAGYKLTKPRREISRWLAGHTGVFSVKELRSKLPHLDTVSVYRTVELLQTLDIIHPVLTNHGEVHYEKHEKNHHHHAVCDTCEKTTCISDCSLPKKKIKGFTRLHHTLVFTGLCTNCS